MKILERTIDSNAQATLEASGLSPLLARTFAARGITDSKQVRYSMDNLIPYETLLGAEKMATILADAIEQGKRLLIVADYDADGATACAVGIRGLAALGADVGYIIPDRVTHGYGLSPAIAQIACTQDPKPDYIITVDNGIASHEGIEECRKFGVPVLVTDHHLPGDTQPDAEVIVNPNQFDCKFSSKNLAGVGVMWYVLWALQDILVERGIPSADSNFSVEDLFPIVAVGTVADVVALDENNRRLIHLGMERIRGGKSYPGLDALAVEAGVNPRALATSDIAFGIGPRINAAGRLESMDTGVECLITDAVSVAKVLARELNETNTRRKEIESTMVEEAVRQLMTKVSFDRNTAVLYSNDWHQGVIGIVAGRIKEQIWRPTFVLAQGPDGEYKGSGRSIEGFHLRDALDLVDRRYPGLILRFGGHAMAAGLTVKPGGVEEFSEAFDAVASELLRPELLSKELETDGPLKLSEMTRDTVVELKSQVWGQMFPEPIFCDEFDVVESRLIGGGKHLSLTLSKDGEPFKAVRFRYSDTPPAVGSKLKAAYTINMNSFRGVESLQLLVNTFEYIS